jgi:hypothetical protein
VGTRGRVATILAAGLAGFLIVSAVAALVQQVRGGTTPISEGAQQLLAVAIGGVVAALAGFFSSGDD